MRCALSKRGTATRDESDPSVCMFGLCFFHAAAGTSNDVPAVETAAPCNSADQRQTTAQRRPEYEVLLTAHDGAQEKTADKASPVLTLRYSTGILC